MINYKHSGGVSIATTLDHRNITKIYNTNNTQLPIFHSGNDFRGRPLERLAVSACVVDEDSKSTSSPFMFSP